MQRPARRNISKARILKSYCLPLSLDGGDVHIIDLAQGELLPQWLASALSDPQYIKHAYNASFEWGCLSKFMGTLPIDQWRCTMFHGLYCGYTAGLDATGKALGLPADKQKLSTGKALIRYFCVPCAPTKTNGGRTRNYPAPRSGEMGAVQRILHRGRYHRNGNTAPAGKLPRAARA